jgi:hypothetical protein
MATEKNWTVMVYMAGDNNLDSAGVVDLSEMKKVGSTNDINILVQFDREGKNMATNRYFVQKGGTADKDRVASLDETNTGDPKVLEDFVTWGATNYPAKHYLLVLWNHGAGWDDANVFEGDVFSGSTPPVSRKAQTIVTRGATAEARPITFAQARAGLSRTRRALFKSTVAAAVQERAIAFDDQAQDYLDNIELKKVMTSFKKKLKRKIDILGMDACLMSMAEVAYQMRDVADFSVGSEESEPGEGWPYDRILQALAAKPAMTPEELSKTIVTQYLASYKTGDNVTQSAMKLSEIKPLAVAVDGLAKALKSALSDAASRTAIVNVRARVQEYSRPYDDYCDLLHLCDLLDKGVTNGVVKTACAVVKNAAAAALVAAGCKGSTVSNSQGISIYFPKRKLSPLYKTLDFTKKSAWDEFLKAYLGGLGR